MTNDTESLEAAAALVATLSGGGFAAPEGATGRIAELLSLLAARAPAAGLSRYRSPAQVAAAAVSPVAAILQLAPAGHRWAEIGAGSGALGLALAILLPEREIVLVDRRSRSVVFIDMLINRLGLRNCSAVEADLPVAPGLLQPFDVVVARAVAPPATAARLAASVTRDGGTVVLLHGGDADVGGTTTAALELVGQRDTLVPGLRATALRKPGA